MVQITSIEFDGVALRLMSSEGNIVDTVYAVSGNKYLQNPNFSKFKNQGPIPEGTYHISKNNIESRFSIDDPNNFGWLPGFGNHRVTLIPDASTNTYGRDGFFLHGSIWGNGYGSAGCIDLNANDGRVFDLLKKYGAEDISISIKYSSYIKDNFHPVYTKDTSIYEVREDAAETLHSLVEKYPELRSDPSFIQYSNSLGEHAFKTILGYDQCFISGTSIMMGDGCEKGIEDIQENDVVMSFNDAGELVPRHMRAYQIRLAA